MAEERVQRRLTAILAADVVGYSRLMGEDEAGTLARLKTHRESLVEPEVAARQGRIVKLMGDGILIEFASVVDAVACAVAIQRGMTERTEGEPEEQRFVFRIGVNLGDVIIDGEDIYGNGVNVAARLEGLAEPGGICISDRVLEQVEKNVNVGFTYLGAQEVKNIEKPINAYKVLLDPKDAGKIIGAPTTRITSPQKKMVAALLLSIFVVGGGAIWFQLSKPEFEPALVERMAYPLPDEPSIAILPFDNYSDDPKLEFFVKGLTEDLTAALSKTAGLFVISRNSAASYRGKSIKVKEVAEELGVQYLLEGSVQKSGDQLRITVQLIDALTGNHLWADRFDRQASEVFALQDEIAKRVFVELQVKLTEGDHARVASRGTKSLKAWLLRIEAYDELLKWTQESHVRALELYRAAHEADPNWGWPLAGISTIHFYSAKRGWSVSRDEAIRLGMEFAERAIKIGPKEPFGYMALGNLFYLIDQPERGTELRRKAIELAPNSFAGFAGLAMRLKEFGREQEAIELFEKAIRLSPKHPWWVLYGYGLALHLVGRKEDAAETYLKTIDLNPKNANTHARLAALYVDLGRIDEAKVSAQETLRLKPKFSVSRYQTSYPLNDPKRVAWYKDLLLRAGLPE